MKNYWLLIVLLACNVAYGQNKMTNERLDSIQLEAVRLFKEAGYFEKDEPAPKCLGSIYFTEVCSRKNIVERLEGIYLTGVLISHRKRYVLIVDKLGWKFLPQRFIDQLAAFSSYFAVHSTKDEDAEKYIKGLIEIYEYNNR